MDTPLGTHRFVDFSDALGMNNRVMPEGSQSAPTLSLPPASQGARSEAKGTLSMQTIGYTSGLQISGGGRDEEH